ncbi:MAG: 3-isopropylmalate dehydrogenase, partial [Sphingobacterium sp.]
GLQQEAKTVRDAVAETLRSGWRTHDIANADTPTDRVLGTQEIGQKVIEFL